MAVGLWAMVASCSTALGPIVGGLLIEHVNWESVFCINAPIGVFALAFGLSRPPGEPRTPRRNHRFDVPGVLLLAVGLVALIFGVVKGETWGWTSGRNAGVDRRGPGRAGRLLLVRDADRAPAAADAPLPQPFTDHRHDRHRDQLLRDARCHLLRDAVPAERAWLHAGRGRRPHPAVQPRHRGGGTARRRADPALRPAGDHAGRHGAPGGGLPVDADLGRRFRVMPRCGRRSSPSVWASAW